MKINVGIVGYGNLGKAVEIELLKSTNYNLIAIFSRRTIKSKFNTKVEPYDGYLNYKNKIDIMFLCGGSLYDLEEQTEDILKHYDCINTFDTHAKIKSQLSKLEILAKNNNHRVIISCGWDPGIFSVNRALFYAISKSKPICFWGKGVSMGHSDAIRNVNGVIDGVQFTIPNKDAITLAKKGISNENIPSHFRECYVVSGETNKVKIENEIKSIPNYFKGQPTTINFVNEKTLISLKKKLYHKGEIYCNFKSNYITNSFKFSLKTSSNPVMTAKIMVAYAKALNNLKEQNITGAFSPLDIPVSMLYNKNEKDLLLSLC